MTVPAITDPEMTRTPLDLTREVVIPCVLRACTTPQSARKARHGHSALSVRKHGAYICTKEVGCMPISTNHMRMLDAHVHRGLAGGREGGRGWRAGGAVSHVLLSSSKQVDDEGIKGHEPSDGSWYA